MRELERAAQSLILLTILLMIGAIPRGNAFTNGQAAILVIGQGSFTTATAATTINGLFRPVGVTFDSSGDLWASDSLNNRVLEYQPSFSTGMNALLVIGQPSFTTNTAATTATGFSGPFPPAFDSSGNLWVPDASNSRVLEFVPPFSNGMAASLVIGQSTFTTGIGATTASGLMNPSGVKFDSSGNMWISDTQNSRVLEYVPPFSTGMSASLVIGQTSFTTRTSATTASGLGAPEGAVFDSLGNLWVSDNSNSRVLEYLAPFSTGMSASLVIGQSSFTIGTSATTATGLSFPSRVAFDPLGNLWVPDSSNNRVTQYITPFSNGEPASLVIGQSSFTTNTVAVTATGLNSPAAIAFDSSGNLWVPDYFSNRILEYNAGPGIARLPATTLWSPFGPWEKNLQLTVFGTAAPAQTAFATGGANGLDILDVQDNTLCTGPANLDMVCTQPVLANQYPALEGYDLSLTAPPASSLVSAQPGSQATCSSTAGGFATGCGFWSLLNMKQKQNSQTLCTGGAPPGCTNNAAFLPGGGNPALIRRSLTQAGGLLHLSPFLASTPAELEVLSLVYDSMLRMNPEQVGNGLCQTQIGGTSQCIDWMTKSHNTILNSPVAGDTTMNFELRSDILWHDGPPVTARDVCFTILSYKQAPSTFFGTFVANVVTCTAFGASTASVVFNTISPSLELNVGNLLIIPEHVWSPLCGGLVAGGDSCVAPALLAGANIDPVANHQLVGSGPWVCIGLPGSPNPGVIGGNCTTFNFSQTVPAGFKVVLSRYDFSVHTYMNCCPNEMRSNLQLLEWADYNKDEKVEIADIASVAFNWCSPNPYWLIPALAGTCPPSPTQVVAIVIVATVAFYFDEGTTAPYQGSPTSTPLIAIPPALTGLDPHLDPYLLTTSPAPLYLLEISPSFSVFYVGATGTGAGTITATPITLGCTAASATLTWNPMASPYQYQQPWTIGAFQAGCSYSVVIANSSGGILWSGTA